MKVNLISEVLIATMALTPMQKASAQLNKRIIPITNNLDKFIPSEISLDD